MLRRDDCPRVRLRGGVLGLMAAKKKARRKDPSGGNLNPGRLLRAPAAELARQSALAAAEGLSWNEWVLKQLRR